MIVEINCAHRKFYYDFRDDLAEKAYELQLEFDAWLRNVKGNHPFKQYHEWIERDGSVSFAGYVNTFGPDDFIAWLNVEKYKSVVAKPIDTPVDRPAFSISF